MHLSVTIEFQAAIFAWFLCCFGRLSRAWWLITWRVTQLHDAVRENSEKGATTDIKVQVPRIYAEECILDKACVCNT